MRHRGSQEEDSETKFPCRKLNGEHSWNLWGKEESSLKQKETLSSDVVTTKLRFSHEDSWC